MALTYERNQLAEKGWILFPTRASYDKQSMPRQADDMQMREERILCKCTITDHVVHNSMPSGLSHLPTLNLRFPFFDKLSLFLLLTMGPWGSSSLWDRKPCIFSIQNSHPHFLQVCMCVACIYERVHLHVCGGTSTHTYRCFSRPQADMGSFPPWFYTLPFEVGSLS